MADMNSIFLDAIDIFSGVERRGAAPRQKGKLLISRRSYLGDINSAISQPIEGACRAQTGPCQHIGQVGS